MSATGNPPVGYFASASYPSYWFRNLELGLAGMVFQCFAVRRSCAPGDLTKERKKKPPHELRGATRDRLLIHSLRFFPRLLYSESAETDSLNSGLVCCLVVQYMHRSVKYWFLESSE